MSARRVLVTGGAGFIGSHLCQRLVRDGWSVRVVDDFSSGKEENLAEIIDEVELIRGDFLDRSLLERAIDDVEVVFHEGAVPSVPRSIAEPERTNEVNITGTLGLLEAARHAGVRRFVFAASSSAYGDTPELPKHEDMPPRPMSPYALQKYTAERYCQLYASLFALETVALRYFNVYGPRQDPKSQYAAVVPSFITACLRGESPTIFGDGEQTRDFTFVGDVVEANLLAASAEAAVGQVINVAGGRRVSLNALFEEIRDVSGASVVARYAEPRVGDVRDSFASQKRAQDVLGYRPAVSLAEGLRETVDFFRGAQPEASRGQA